MKYITVSSAKLEEIRVAAQSMPIVYVLPIASRIDFFLLKQSCIKFSLPIPQFAPDIPKRWAIKSTDLQSDLEMISKGITNDQASCLFLRKGRHNGLSIRSYELLWEEALRAIDRKKANVLFVPLFFSWSHRPGDLKRSAFDTLFQENANIKWGARAFSLVWNHKKMALTIGDAVASDSFFERVGIDNIHVHAKKLRRSLANFLYRERYAMSGPPLQTLRRMTRSVLKDAQLQNEIKSFSARKKISLSTSDARVRKILKEMMAVYHPFYTECFATFIEWASKKMFSTCSISDESIARLREDSKKGALMILPNHRSHMDYMLISYLFLKNKLSLPRIAAGINLAFFPAGFLFRRCGAYFIRRSLNGDLLYSKTLKAYVRWLIAHDITQEFFIEGGRSRTGKLIEAKLGLLTFQIESFLRKPTRDLILIPTSMMYDWVPEQSSLLREALGEKKEKENFRSLLKVKSLLKRNHGEVRIEFGQSISMKEYFKDEISQKITSPSKSKLRELGKVLIFRISQSSKVSTRLLASSCFLKFTDPFTKEDFMNYFQTLATCIEPKYSGIEYKEIENYWKQAIQEQWLKEISDQQFILSKEIRPYLDYHKHSILHHFAPMYFAFSTDTEKEILLKEFPYINDTHQAAPNNLQVEALRTLFQPNLTAFTVSTGCHDNDMFNVESVIERLKKVAPQWPELQNKILIHERIETMRYENNRLRLQKN